MTLGRTITTATLAMFLAACASWNPQYGAHHTGSVVDFLYPNAKEAPQLRETVTYLRPPVAVGIAFAPGGQAESSGPAEGEKLKLLEHIKASFAQYPFIGRIEIIPTQYLRPGGGFDNLDQVARMFNVEVMALISYDQLQFNDSNGLSILYWTIVGAYIIHGDDYDIQTMVDTSVFDIASRKLLFRAPGASQVKGSAALVEFNQEARAARLDGYNQAINALLPNLHAELDRFRERIKTGNEVKVENKPGYNGGGSAGIMALFLFCLLFFAHRHARRPD